MSGDYDPELEAMARALDASGDYRVLRRFRPVPHQPLDNNSDSAVGLVLDFETTGFDIEQKDVLKQRGYRWNNGSDGRPKSWYRDLAQEEEPAELDWLEGAMFGGRSGRCRVEVMDARTRYSDRAG